MIRIAARNITKRYGGVNALAGVDFDIHAGAVNVLIGENGAGKSTLMRIVAGVERPCGGTLLLDGQPIELGSVRDAAAHGIGIVHQELSLCPNLTVAQNIFLPPAGGSRRLLIDRSHERAEAVRLLRRLGSDIDPDAIIGDLSIGEQQVVEIARALSRDTKILILDEPTSALSAAETERLFAVIGELRTAGVAIVYISHRMGEIERIGDHVTVLRDGQLVATAPRGEFSISWIVRHMLGEERVHTLNASPEPGPTILTVWGVTARRRNGNIAVDDVSFELRAGEMTAIYGLLGAGRSELFEALCGARVTNGSVLLDGCALHRLPLHERLQAGLRFVPEDRKAEGIFHNLAVAENLSLSVIDQLRRVGILSAAAEDRVVRPMMARMGVKAPSPAARIGALSGGNQQKVLIGRSLMAAPKVLLLDEPGRGVDVGARAEIFATMRELVAGGVAVLFSTSDLTDAMGAADRILVMSCGRITADVSASDAQEEALVRAASVSVIPSPEAEAA